MPLNSSLIRGAQSLFGVKTQLQFGKTTITGVFRAKSQTKSLVAQGGGTIQDFDMFALDYDSDRHFSYPSILETDTISLLLIIHL
jgi:cell surface protein SprA